MKDDIRALVAEMWPKMKSGPAEQRARELMVAGKLDELTGADVQDLLIEIGNMRRAVHPLLYRLDIR